MAKLRQKWPGDEDLLSWWILHKVATSPLHDLDDPDAIKAWLQEFRKLSKHGVHLLLYAKYHNFRLEYVNPHYAGYVGDTDVVIKH